VLEALDFTTQAAQLEGPVYLFAGRNAVNTMSSLVEGYYDLLQAPTKEPIWLEGGHGLDGENLGQLVEVMVYEVLAQTRSNS
jgi:hypothetical protein